MNNLAAEEMPSVGKYDLIAELAKGFVQENGSTVSGIGDDAAVIDPSADYVVSSSKVFMENVHFDLTYVPLQYLGYKVVTVVCSDLLAMNAIPTQITLNVAISNRFDLKAVQDLLDGVATCCENLHVDVVGLDITTSRRDLIISATAMGECEPAQLVKRQGASDNELLCVSGDFAAAYAGLLLLEREKKVFDANPGVQPDFGGQDYLLRRQLRPEARLDIVEALRRENIVPTAMVNVCDGMAAALMQICRASDKGAILFEERIPMTELTFNTLKSFDIVHTVAALNGGDDYELMFTIRQADFEKIKNVENVSIVGYIKEQAYGCQLLTSDNHQIEIKAQGFSKIQHHA
ncbi:MAG: thiamine-phosphate kinase [Bacteroidales bacterium]|nr:thiamine-phosphate kinase [Bacteroidales bacterium]